MERIFTRIKTLYELPKEPSWFLVLLSFGVAKISILYDKE